MVTIPQRVLGEALLFSARKYPSKTAIIVKTREYSYSNLKESSENIAYHLVQAGIKKGDRVAIYMNNSWESIVSIYGITLAGAAFLVINPQTKADKLQYILKDSGARILFSESIQNNELSQALVGLTDIQEVVIAGDLNRITRFPSVKFVDFEDTISYITRKSVLPIVIPNDLAALIYTSGSTGFPKGVMLTHQSMVFTAWSLV